jgi:hypothetical protein
VCAESSSGAHLGGGLRTGHLLIGGALVVLILGGGSRAIDWAWRHWRCPTRNAAWIWSPEAEPGKAPVTFLAIHDFHLAYPATAARLLVQGDEEAHVYLNGEPIALYRYLESDALASIEVARFLLPGENRIAVELRSSQGMGGLLLALEVTGREHLWFGTDASWRIVRELGEQTLVAGTPLPEAEPARVLSLPPAGRWGRPVAGPEQPPLRGLLLRADGMPPHRARSEILTRWTTVGAADWETPPVGRRVVFDWGQEVTGYLNFSFSLTRGAKGLYFAGRGPKDPDRAVPTGWLEKLDGTRTWTATEPRSFRYVTVVSTTPLNGARVFLADPSQPAVRIAEGPVKGVFGLEPVPLATPAEDEIRGELESLEGLAGGEGL